MAIITTSGRVVKRKVCGVRPIMRACRAKAPAPWAGAVYLPPNIADAVAAIRDCYEVSRNEDCIAFQGNTVYNYAFVALPTCCGSPPPFVGSQCMWPKEAFVLVAREWLAEQDANVARWLAEQVQAALPAVRCGCGTSEVPHV